jgi:hypothetical protein
MTENNAPTTSARLKPKGKRSDGLHCEAITANSARAREPTSVSICAASVRIASEFEIRPAANSTTMNTKHRIKPAMIERFARNNLARSAHVPDAARAGWAGARVSGVRSFISTKVFSVLEMTVGRIFLGPILSTFNKVQKL